MSSSCKEEMSEMIDGEIYDEINVQNIKVTESSREAIDDVSIVLNA